MNPHAVQPPIAIRLASPGDAEGIRQVYAPFAHTPVTFEEVEPDPAEFRGRMEEILAFYPGLVACEEDGRVVGFAYAHRQSKPTIGTRSFPSTLPTARKGAGWARRSTAR